MISDWTRAKSCARELVLATNQEFPSILPKSRLSNSGLINCLDLLSSSIGLFILHYLHHAYVWFPPKTILEMLRGIMRDRSIQRADEASSVSARRIDNLMASVAIPAADRSLPWPRPSTTFALRRTATSGAPLRPADGSSRGHSDCDRRAVDTYRC